MLAVTTYVLVGKEPSFCLRIWSSDFRPLGEGGGGGGGRVPPFWLKNVC